MSRCIGLFRRQGKRRFRADAPECRLFPEPIPHAVWRLDLVEGLVNRPEFFAQAFHVAIYRSIINVSIPVGRQTFESPAAQLRPLRPPILPATETQSTSARRCGPSRSKCS